MQIVLSPAVTQAVERMPAFPHSVQRILEMTRDMQCAPKDLVQVIESDPLMLAKVLRVVNSAQFGLQKKIYAVGHSVVFLGINTIKNIALGVATIGMLPNVTVGRFTSARFLRHSLATAAAAKALAPAKWQCDPMEIFITGLLHDLGKVVLAQHLPKEFSLAMEYSQWHGVPLHQALRQTLGTDHFSIGAVLLERWQFASPIVHAVALQQSASDCTKSILASCVFIANQACKRHELDDGADSIAEPCPVALFEALGIDEAEATLRIGDPQVLLELVRTYAMP